ncbi:MAG: sigma-54 dependent transcriptional regulator [Vicinamibacteria bacterium]
MSQGARPPRVLVVDDDDGVRSGLRRFLTLSGFEVSEARDCAEAVDAASRTAPEAALVDYNLPDGSGVELLARLKAAAADLPVIVLTGHGSIELAVQAIKEGAEQFLTKPADPHAVVVLLKRVIESSRDQRQRVARQSRNGDGGPDPFLGPSAATRDLRASAEAARGSDSTVLILGETGVGKGVLARWLHGRGARAAEPFVDLNCASLSRELVETELFGHEAGAFTGAVKSKQGLFEVAHRGTVFLDEIGDLELALQPKLLTVLEERRFRRVGEVRDRRVDVRLIAATHQDLERRVAEQAFRSDLFYRISAVVLRIPALRERREDIPSLAAAVLADLCRDLGRSTRVALSPGALAALQAHAWPGNVRELRNALERALLSLEPGRPIEAEDMRLSPSAAPAASASDRFPLTLEEVERAHIERVLRGEKGNVARAAARLGISKASLYQRLHRWNIAQFTS